MPRTYSEIMSHTAYLQQAQIVPYTGYNAILYARWLPFAVLSVGLSGILLILSLFLPAWFYTENLLQQTSQFTGIQIAGNGILLIALVPPYHVSFSFPPLWFLVFLGIALVILSLLLLRSKILSPSLLLSIKLAFGLAVLTEITYLFYSLFVTNIEFSKSLGAGPSYDA